MKKSSKQDNRKIKLNKIKKAKKLKNKKIIKEKLRAKPVIITERAFTYSFSKKSVMLTGMVFVVSYLFLLNPIVPLRAGMPEEKKMNQISPAVVIAEKAATNSKVKPLASNKIPAQNKSKKPKQAVTIVKNAPVAKLEKINQITPAIATEKVMAANSSPISLTISELPAQPKSETHDQIMKIVKNTPMEEMVEVISQRDKNVAAFMIGIGMKESKFGIYSPKKNGAECYNYWGYRGKENTTQSGYSCFDSPEHAVEVVGNRIESLVNKGLKTPSQMIVWKCGSTCAGHSPESVDKWIKDVSIHYYGLTQSKEVAVNFNK